MLSLCAHNCSKNVYPFTTTSSYRYRTLTFVSVLGSSVFESVFVSVIEFAFAFAFWFGFYGCNF
jgi:hypothetical protein